MFLIKYLVIDEFEIGCGEETVLALTEYINDKLAYLFSKKLIEGAMIITHSKLGVRYLKYDHFLNIEGMSADEWLNRKIVPTNLDELEKNELFFLIRDNQKK